MPVTDDVVYNILKGLSKDPYSPVAKAMSKNKRAVDITYTDDAMKKIASAFTLYLYRAICETVSKSFPLSAIHVGDAKQSNTNIGGKSYKTINVYIDNDALWRESLWYQSDSYDGDAPSWSNHENVYKNPSTGTYGIKDIVYLTATGRNARHSIHIHDNVWTKAYAKPNPEFLLNAVRQFNSYIVSRGYSDVFVELAGPYAKFK